MTEVEKLYSLAGVEDELFYDQQTKTWSRGYFFEPEKQIELIKWLAIKGDFDSSIDIAKNTYDFWTIYFQGARWTAEGFEESLAGLINNLWQSLTEEEHKQVKGILE